VTSFRSFCPPQLNFELEEAFRLTIEQGKHNVLSFNEDLNIYEKIEQMHNKLNEMVDEDEAKTSW
jgi:hypothetical protein